MKTPMLSVSRAGQVRIAGELAGYVVRAWDGWTATAYHRGEYRCVRRQMAKRGDAVEALLLWRSSTRRDAATARATVRGECFCGAHTYGLDLDGRPLCDACAL